MKRLLPALLTLLILPVAEAGPAEKAAEALFEGKADAAAAAKVWKKKRLKPEKALKMLQGLLPYEKGKRKDHTVALKDLHGRKTDLHIGIPKEKSSTGKFGVLIVLRPLIYFSLLTAFGLRSRTIIFRYALKVAVLPTITLIGIGFGGLLSGTVFAEIIFARPGIGKVIYDMVLARNFPVVQGAVLATIALYVVVTLIADLVVSWLDPRVRDSL